MPFYLLGRRLREVYPFVPLSPQRRALSIGVVSYDGGVFFGLVGDRDALADIDRLAEAFAAALAEQTADDLGPDDDRGAERHAVEDEAQGPVGRADAAGGGRVADRPGSAVDRQAVTADPALRQVRLVGVQRRDAAAVVGVALVGQRVGDREAAGRRVRARRLRR